MKTVFSHIVHKRLSMENENVATEALNFIINSSKAARSGLMKLLYGIDSDLPILRFQTQQTGEGLRPDLWGLDGNEPRVFIENKFWAGLTEGQPTEYLKLLAKCNQPTVLLVVVPEARMDTVWRELLQRILQAKISMTDQAPSSNIYRMTETELGPHLALTSWKKLLSAIEVELTDEPQTRNDLLQLRSLCDVADEDAFIPLSSEELTNQRYPALIFHLNSIVQKFTNIAANKGLISIEGLRPAHSWDGIGRYLSFFTCGGWLGIHFRYWKEFGGTPLWLTFYSSNWGRAEEARVILEPWGKTKGIFTTMEERHFAIGLDLPSGEELDTVVGVIVKLLGEVSEQLSTLPDKKV